MTTYRLFCAKCGAKGCAAGFERARSEAEKHARITGHWGKSAFWALGLMGETLGPVRIAYEHGTRYLHHRRARVLPARVAPISAQGSAGRARRA